MDKSVEPFSERVSLVQDFVTRFSAGSFYWVGLTDEKSGRWEWVNQTPYVMNRRYDLESSITWTSARWHRSGTPPCRGRQHDVGHFSSQLLFV